MNTIDQIVLANLIVIAIVALCVAVPFGIWMGSWSAGIFMFFAAFLFARK
jgi:uncharacterized protein YqfA (UPF0365 family)